MELDAARVAYVRQEQATAEAEAKSAELQASLDESLDYGHTLVLQVEERGKKIVGLEEALSDAEAQVRVRDALELESQGLRDQVS